MARPNLAVLEQRKKQFIQPFTDVDKLLKLLGKEAEAAVRKLVKLMASEDEKISLQAAKALVDYNLAVSNEKEKREITRLIASIKYPNGTAKNLTTGDDRDDDVPSLNFDEIVTIDD